jgi:TRAP-type uncharacterized transport system substrate-binding protein
MRSKYLSITILVVLLTVMLVPTIQAETKFFAIATGGTAGTY